MQLYRMWKQLDFCNLHNWNLFFCYLSAQLVLSCTHTHRGIMMIYAVIKTAEKCRVWVFFGWHVLFCFPLSILEPFLWGQVTYTGCILGITVMTETAKQHIFLDNMLRYLMAIWKPFSNNIEIIFSTELHFLQDHWNSCLLQVHFPLPQLWVKGNCEAVVISPGQQPRDVKRHAWELCPKHLPPPLVGSKMCLGFEAKNFGASEQVKWEGVTQRILEALDLARWQFLLFCSSLSTVMFYNQKYHKNKILFSPCQASYLFIYSFPVHS